MSLPPGTLIASRYEVVKCLGAGSMGLVYACRRRGEAGSGLVAVKVLFPEVARDKTQLARFRNEVFAAYGVSHPNVVKVGEYSRDGDLVFYTMEFVSGGDLATKLGRAAEKIPIAATVKMLSQMAAGVQAIHDAGVIHRDLKPENILLTKEGDVKIADFGIARLEMGTGRKLTEHGGVVGTIDYVAPEYLLNSQIDGRGDIYALGILGYEMIAGESPFKGDSIYDTMWKRIKYDPIPPSQIRPECPARLDAIILKAMARAPEERYQTARDMCEQLNSIGPISEEPQFPSSSTGAESAVPSSSDGQSGVSGGEYRYRGAESPGEPTFSHSLKRSESNASLRGSRNASNLNRNVNRRDPWGEGIASEKLTRLESPMRGPARGVASETIGKDVFTQGIRGSPKEQLYPRPSSVEDRNKRTKVSEVADKFLRFIGVSVTGDDLLLLVLTMGVVVGLGLLFRALGFYSTGL